MRFFLATCFFTCVFAFTLAGDLQLFLDFAAAKKHVLALGDLHRLATLSTKIFVNTDDPNEIEFWRALGNIPPLKDPWGRSYHLNAGHQTAEWQSAGPDGLFGTADDLSLKVPVGRAIPESSKHFSTPSAASAK